MGTVLTFLILTAYLAFTQFLGLLLYKRFERRCRKWSERVKKSKKQPETAVNEELEKKIALLEKQLAANEVPAIPSV
jgi:peptidoglycan/LPS O-acetylase OafA/YrhL